VSKIVLAVFVVFHSFPAEFASAATRALTQGPRGEEVHGAVEDHQVRFSEEELGIHLVIFFGVEDEVKLPCLLAPVT